MHDGRFSQASKDKALKEYNDAFKEMTSTGALAQQQEKRS